MKTRSKLLALLTFTVALGVALAAYADSTNGPVNALPKVNIVQDNGQPNAKGFSTNPQIASCVFDGTGTTAATTSLTVYADATHFPCTALRGQVMADSTLGELVIGAAGLYRVSQSCNGTGTTADVMTNEASISTDGGTTWTQINGSNSIADALTGDLTKNFGGGGYVTVTSGQAAGASNPPTAASTVIAMRGKNSAHTTTCASGNGLRLERVDLLQPPTLP